MKKYLIILVCLFSISLIHAQDAPYIKAGITTFEFTYGLDSLESFESQFESFHQYYSNDDIEYLRNNITNHNKKIDEPI